MNRKWILGTTGWAAAAASMLVCCGAYAAEPELSDPTRLTVVKNTPIFEHFQAQSPAGVLAYFQTLQVKETVSDGTVLWYKVDTWLGERWISKNAGTVIEGEIESVNFTAHTLREEGLYDAPSHDGRQEAYILPQEINVTGRYQDWYRIYTADRQPKWLNDPLLLEEIREEPAGFDMLLTREEQLYETPYLQKAPIALSPQTVHVLAKWDTGEEGYRFRQIVWYKIRTDQGPRWVLPRGEKIGVVQVEESVTLPTGGYGTSAPETQESAVWFEPGTVLQAKARWMDWLQVSSGTSGLVWVNPALSLKRRPLGTVSSSEMLHLTGETAAYTYPSPEAVAHPKGFYAPQEVQSIAKWTGDDKLDWYLIHGFDGDLWIPKPRDANDRSLVGSWSLLQPGMGMPEGSGAPLDITLTKYSQRHGFEPGEGIPFTLRVRRTSDQALVLAEPTQFELQILQLDGLPEESVKQPERQQAVWTRKLPKLDTAFPERMSTQAMFIEWDQKDDQGRPLPPGEYAARIVPAPIPYKLGNEDGVRTMTEEEMQAVLSVPERFAILPDAQ